MNTKENQLPDAMLLEADISTLDNEQLVRRFNLINVRKMERELALVEDQNRKFDDDKQEWRRRQEQRKGDLEATNAKIAQEQNACKHKTGGLGLDGWFNGDGKLYGSATALQVLPTGEIYGICFRCQKEWHAPKKSDVLTGQITLAQYFQQAKEYNEMLKWERGTFQTPNGEIPGSILFRIPKLELQRAKDDQAFSEYLSTLPAQTVEMARAGVTV